jgi:hypothetical protein
MTSITALLSIKVAAEGSYSSTFPTLSEPAEGDPAGVWQLLKNRKQLAAITTNNIRIF